MLYQSDFKPPPFQPRFDYQKSLSQLRKGKIINKKHLQPEVILKHESDDDDDAESKSQFLKKWFYSFCENTSIHGVKYIGQSDLHWTERLCFCYNFNRIKPNFKINLNF